jgi:hypothetical protein
MSRTDVHRPIWVQARDRVPGVSEVHDHRHGPCDLDESREARVHSYPWRMSTWRWPRTESFCYFHINFYDHYSGRLWPHYRRKAYKRIYAHQERADWRRLEHQLLTAEHPDDVQDPLYRRSRHSIRWDEW